MHLNKELLTKSHIVLSSSKCKKFDWQWQRELKIILKDGSTKGLLNRLKSKQYLLATSLFDIH